MIVLWIELRSRVLDFDKNFDVCFDAVNGVDFDGKSDVDSDTDFDGDFDANSDADSDVNSDVDFDVDFDVNFDVGFDTWISLLRRKFQNNCSLISKWCSWIPRWSLLWL